MKAKSLFCRSFGVAVMLGVAGMIQAGDVIYVSPSGNDENPGTAAKPLASLQKAVDKAVAVTNAPQEIVIREGIYPGIIKIQQNTNSPAQVLPLVIRAERKKDGTYEDVIFDGGQSVTGAVAVAGMAGVYQYPAKFRSSASPSMWEYDTRIRYKSVADEESVKAYPATFFSTGKEVLFHTSDGQPPETRAIGLGRDHMGISVQRSNVTLQGLQFRNFLLERGSGGVVVNGTENRIEDCRVWNSVRGFNVGAEAVDARILRCRADDVGCGVFSYGKHTIVEDCQFFRKAGPFEVHLYSQDQSGIQCYSPAQGGEMRRNLCVGFNLGLFFKCPQSRFVAENNTLLKDEGLGSGMGCNFWDPESVFRYNVVRGFSKAVYWGENGIPKSTVVAYNCLWEKENGERLIRQLKEFGGIDNVNAEPRFKDPDKDDFRLLPDSPGARMGPSNLVAGAFGIADARPCRLIPPVKDSVSDLAESTDKMPAIAFARAEVAYVKRDGPPRIWYVDSTAGLDNVQNGSEANPLKSLQFALNHAIPGDRIVLKPGLYSGAHVLEHGGTESAPITIESASPWKAILDGAQRVDACLTLKGAPYVVIKDLEIRWFMKEGIYITNSPSVTVQGCRVWNKDWSKGRVTGNGITVINSPKVTLDHNVFFALNAAFYFGNSPEFRLTYNTAAKLLHQCGRINKSASGSICKNNSFTFTGNVHLDFIGGSKDEILRFVSDYNNLAMYVREKGALRRPLPEDDIKPEPNDFFRSKESKGVMELNGERLFSLREWQEKTGLDKHSIYKHPRYADPLNRDFRLNPDSPNIGAGENGTDIGALPVKKD